MKSEHQKRVEEFMVKASQEVPSKPTVPSPEVRLLRAKLIFEEAMETIQKGLGIAVSIRLSIPSPFKNDQDWEVLIRNNNGAKFVVTGPFDMAETIDGCCDLKVVTTGTLSACGVPDAVFQQAVDYNNLEKFGPGGHRNEAGKWIKPPGHKPPDIAGILKGLGWLQ